MLIFNHFIRVIKISQLLCAVSSLVGLFAPETFGESKQIVVL